MKEIILQHELDIIDIRPRKKIEVVDISPRKRKCKTKECREEKEAGFLLIGFFFMLPVLMLFFG